MYLVCSAKWKKVVCRNNFSSTSTFLSSTAFCSFLIIFRICDGFFSSYFSFVRIIAYFIQFFYYAGPCLCFTWAEPRLTVATCPTPPGIRCLSSLFSQNRPWMPCSGVNKNTYSYTVINVVNPKNKNFGPGSPFLCKFRIWMWIWDSQI